MPWELTLVKYDGEPPRRVSDASRDRYLAMGTLEEVQQHISSVLPATEWVKEPSPIEVMKHGGSDSWKDWDDEMIASASQRKLKGYFLRDDLSLEIYGFEQEGPLRYVLVEVRGEGDAISTLRALCCPVGWSAHDMSRDAAFIDLTGSGNTRWSFWKRFRDFAIGRAADGE